MIVDIGSRSGLAVAVMSDVTIGSDPSGNFSGLDRCRSLPTR